MTSSTPTNIAREPNLGFDAEAMAEAALEAVRDALRRHKALGQSIVVWRNGRVAIVPPEEIEV